MWRTTNSRAELTAPDPSQDPEHKDHPYGRWAENEAWKQRLQRRGCHKALDIAEEMDFKQDIDNSRQTGMGWKELAVIGAMLLGAGGMSLLGIKMFSDDNNVPQQTQQTTPNQEYLPPVDSDYMVRFWDKDGNPIDVPHISKRPKDGQ